MGTKRFLRQHGAQFLCKIHDSNIIISPKEVQFCRIWICLHQLYLREPNKGISSKPATHLWLIVQFKNGKFRTPKFHSQWSYNI